MGAKYRLKVSRVLLQNPTWKAAIEELPDHLNIERVTEPPFDIILSASQEEMLAVDNGQTSFVVAHVADTDLESTYDAVRAAKAGARVAKAEPLMLESVLSTHLRKSENVLYLQTAPEGPREFTSGGYEVRIVRSRKEAFKRMDKRTRMILLDKEIQPGFLKAIRKIDNLPPLPVRTVFRGDLEERLKEISNMPEVEPLNIFSADKHPHLSALLEGWNFSIIPLKAIKPDSEPRGKYLDLDQLGEEAIAFLEQQLVESGDRFHLEASIYYLSEGGLGDQPNAVDFIVHDVPLYLEEQAKIDELIRNKADVSVPAALARDLTPAQKRELIDKNHMKIHMGVRSSGADYERLIKEVILQPGFIKNFPEAEQLLKYSEDPHGFPGYHPIIESSLVPGPAKNRVFRVTARLGKAPDQKLETIVKLYDFVNHDEKEKKRKRAEMEREIKATRYYSRVGITDPSIFNEYYSDSFNAIIMRGVGDINVHDFFEQTEDPEIKSKVRREVFKLSAKAAAWGPKNLATKVPDLEKQYLSRIQRDGDFIPNFKQLCVNKKVANGELSEALAEIQNNYGVIIDILKSMPTGIYCDVNWRNWRLDLGELDQGNIELKKVDFGTLKWKAAGNIDDVATLFAMGGEIPEEERNLLADLYFREYQDELKVYNKFMKEKLEAKKKHFANFVIDEFTEIKDKEKDDEVKAGLEQLIKDLQIPNEGRGRKVISKEFLAQKATDQKYHKKVQTYIEDFLVYNNNMSKKGEKVRKSDFLRGLYAGEVQRGLVMAEFHIAKVVNFWEEEQDLKHIKAMHANALQALKKLRAYQNGAYRDSIIQSNVKTKNKKLAELSRQEVTLARLETAFEKLEKPLMKLEYDESPATNKFFEYMRDLHGKKY